jgi:hypothetical protein
MKKLIISLLIFTTISLFTKAQRTYFETEISGELFKNFELSLAPQIRFREGFELKEYLVDAGAEYKFNKYFSLVTSYRFGTDISKNNNKTYYSRWAFDAKTSVKWNNLKPSFRLRYTNAKEDFSESEATKVQYLRYKLQLAYNINSSKLTPYINSEYLQSLTSDDLNYTRFEGGVEYKLNKHHQLGSYYRLNLQSETGKTLNIIGITYKFKL